MRKFDEFFLDYAAVKLLMRPYTTAQAVHEEARIVKIESQRVNWAKPKVEYSLQLSFLPFRQLNLLWIFSIRIPTMA